MTAPAAWLSRRAGGKRGGMTDETERPTQDDIDDDAEHNELGYRDVDEEADHDERGSQGPGAGEPPADEG